MKGRPCRAWLKPSCTGHALIIGQQTLAAAMRVYVRGVVAQKERPSVRRAWGRGGGGKEGKHGVSLSDIPRIGSCGCAGILPKRRDGSELAIISAKKMMFRRDCTIAASVSIAQRSMVGRRRPHLRASQF